MLIDTTEPLGYPVGFSPAEAEGTLTVPARSTIVLKQIEPPVMS